MPIRLLSEHLTAFDTPLNMQPPPPLTTLPLSPQPSPNSFFRFQFHCVLPEHTLAFTCSPRHPHSPTSTRTHAQCRNGARDILRKILPTPTLRFCRCGV